MKLEEWGIGEGGWSKVEAACKVEGCALADLLRAWVAGDRVVLIISPGRKRTVDVGGLFPQDEGPVSDVVHPGAEGPTDSAARAGPGPVTFEEFLSPRLYGLLEGAGLLDPDDLRDRSDDDLLAVDGIGPKTVGILRELLERYEEKRRSLRY